MSTGELDQGLSSQRFCDWLFRGVQKTQRFNHLKRGDNQRIYGPPQVKLQFLESIHIVGVDHGQHNPGVFHCQRKGLIFFDLIKR